MSFDNSFYSVDHSEYAPTRLRKVSRCLTRVALLFGSAGLALSLIVVPLLNQQAARSLQESVFPEGVDRSTTASIKRAPVVHNNKAAKDEILPVANTTKSNPAIHLRNICIIEANGVHQGDC